MARLPKKYSHLANRLSYIAVVREDERTLRCVQLRSPDHAKLTAEEAWHIAYEKANGKNLLPINSTDIPKPDEPASIDFGPTG